MTDVLIEPFRLPFMARALAELALLGLLGGVVGVFVLLRRLAFLADALTHTVFPGVVVGFMVGGRPGITVGALCAAVISTAALTALTAHGRVHPDAALAILLTSFFAVGVVLVSRRHSYTADLTAFLFGKPLVVDGRDIIITAAVAAVVLLTLALARSELVLRAFDPLGAAALGYPVLALDLVLNLVLAAVIVTAAHAVGTVLVIAIMIVPAAAARLLSDRLSVITLLAAAIGVLGAWLGLGTSYWVSLEAGVHLAAGPTVVGVLVLAYLAALAAAPRRRGLARPRPVTEPEGVLDGAR